MKNGNNGLVLIDFRHIYYKFLQMVITGRLSRLSYNEIDTTMIYNVLKSVEKMTEKGKLKAVICFDSKSNRSSEDSEYKANRKKEGQLVLDKNDFEQLDKLQEILEIAGYTTYKVDGAEADDLIYSVIEAERNNYDFINVYTKDKDLFCLVDDKVTVYMAVPKKGYFEISKENFEEMMEQFFKVKIPYNCIIPYKCTVGDTSDNIKGVVGFGEKAFEPLLNTINKEYYKLFNNSEIVKDLLTQKAPKGKVDEALKALNLVALRKFDVNKEINLCDLEKRKEIYEKYGMFSLI